LLQFCCAASGWLSVLGSVFQDFGRAIAGDALRRIDEELGGGSVVVDDGGCLAADADEEGCGAEEREGEAQHLGGGGGEGGGVRGGRMVGCSEGWWGRGRLFDAGGV